jgi:hypothetical protein
VLILRSLEDKGVQVEGGTLEVEGREGGTRRTDSTGGGAEEAYSGWLVICAGVGNRHVVCGMLEKAAMIQMLRSIE